GDFQFYLNEQSVGTTTNFELDKIARGQYYDLTMEMKVASSGTGSSLRYDVSFGENPEGTQFDNEILNAIEVYEDVDGRISYRCSLKELFNNPISGYLTGNGYKKINYKLVYSKGADESFDGRRFSMQINALPSMVTSGTEMPYYYISKASDLAALANQYDKDDYTIVLTRDINLSTLEKNVVFSRPVSLELDGHSLNLGGNNIIFNWAGSTGARNGIYNSFNYSSAQIGANEHINKITGGKIIINTPSDAMFVDESLESDYPDIYLVSNGTSTLGFSPIAFQQKIAENITNVYKDKIHRVNHANPEIFDFSQDFEYYLSTHNYIDEDYLTSVPSPQVPMIMNLLTFEGTPLTELQLVSGTQGKYIIAPSFATATDLYYMDVFFSYEGKYPNGTYVDGGSDFCALTIVGTTLENIANYYLNKIPSVIQGSFFLPTYDEESNSYLTWRIRDRKENNNVLVNQLLTKGGIYLPYGIDALESWQDQQILIGVTVENQLGSFDYQSQDVIKAVHILNAKQRTQRIYSNISKDLVVADDVSVIDFNVGQYTQGDTSSAVPFIDPVLATKAGLQGIEINYKNSSEEDKNSYWGEPYFHIDKTDPDFDKLVIDFTPLQLKSLTFKLEITFTYDNNGVNYEEEDTIYVLEKNFVLVGPEDIVAIVDPTRDLQKDFASNMYLNGVGYDFYARNYSSNGTHVKFTILPNSPGYIDSTHSNYLTIDNGLNDLGFYLKDPNGYYFFPNLVTVRSSNGTVLVNDYPNNLWVNLINNTSSNATVTTIQAEPYFYFNKPSLVWKEEDGAFRDISIYENPADYAGLDRYIRIEDRYYLVYNPDDSNIDNRYTCKTHVVINPAYVPTFDHELPIEATLLSMEKEEGITTITELADVYHLRLHIDGIYHNIPTEIEDFNLYTELFKIYNVNHLNTETGVIYEDHYIQVKEAQRTFAELASGVVKTLNFQSKTYEYLDFSNKNIKSIKGLEYFTNIKGLNFATNSVISLAPLSNLLLLEYLNFTDNLIADLSPLQFLDNLGYLNFANTSATVLKNNISELTSIRYIPHVQYL
ncbi:MAG: hypothetical protein LBM99_03645, partial [Bacillales bacterium]|nr:hypothetical protein [Bacillales bacterium]